MYSISEIMTINPITLGPKATLEEAGALMKDKRIRHIPILGDKGELLGLVTHRDLLAAASGGRQGYWTSDVMRKDVRTVDKRADLRAAALTMQKFKIGSLVVMDGKVLAGIITDSDYVGLAANLLEQLNEAESEEWEADDLDYTD